MKDAVLAYCWCTGANGKVLKVKVGYYRKGCVAIISLKYFLFNNYKGTGLCMK